MKTKTATSFLTSLFEGRVDSGALLPYPSPDAETLGLAAELRVVGLEARRQLGVACRLLSLAGGEACLAES